MTDTAATNTTNTTNPTILTTSQIQKLLPHRWPFLLVDRIVEYDQEAKRIVGLKSVTATEWFFQRLGTPGDQLPLEVTMERLGSKFGRGHGVATVDGDVACDARLSFIIAPESALRCWCGLRLCQTFTATCRPCR